MRRFRYQLGFTLVELILVIVLLGILSALAIPRFSNLSDSSHKSVVDSLASSFEVSVRIFRSCYYASGAGGFRTDLNCYSETNVASSVTGYPLGTNTSLSVNGTTLVGSNCLELWQALIADNDMTLAFHTDSSFNSETDIIYWYAGGDVTSSSTYCYYNYIRDNPSKGVENWQIRYYPSTGNVTVGRETLS